MAKRRKTPGKSPPKGYRVFLSHSSHDTFIARHLRERIRAINVDVWLDVVDLAGGEVVGTAVLEEIRRSDELLVLVSAASVNSHWVIAEVGIAMGTNKYITPMLVSLKPSDLPGPIRDRNPRTLNDLDVYLEELRARVSQAVRSAKRRR
jgi:hypothetical protein